MCNPQKATIHPMDVKLTAVAYHEATQHLYDNFGTVSYKMAPVGSTAAFACELYLKALLAKTQNGQTTGHKLNALYAQLPTDISSDIEDTTNHSYPFTTRHETFSDCLAEISNAFAELRYIYEYSAYKINFTFLFSFLAALRTVADKYIPMQTSEKTDEHKK